MVTMLLGFLKVVYSFEDWHKDVQPPRYTTLCLLEDPNKVCMVSPDV